MMSTFLDRSLDSPSATPEDCVAEDREASPSRGQLSPTSIWGTRLFDILSYLTGTAGQLIQPRGFAPVEFHFRIVFLHVSSCQSRNSSLPFRVTCKGTYLAPI